LNAVQGQVYHVYIVVLDDALLLDVAGPAEVLRCANLYGSQIAFDVRYVGPQERVRSSTGLVLGEIAPLPDVLENDAILVLAGMSGDFDHNRNVDVLATVRWLERIAPSASRIVCVCSGALVAAVAGLLSGRTCTTHHSLIADLHRLDPSATVLDNRLYVRDGRIYTSAGVTSGTDLMLAIVSELAGPVVASKSARNLVVYSRRAAGDPQISPWLQSRDHLHPVVHRIQDEIESDPVRNWTLPALADIGGVSTRHLSRLFREHVGSNVADYIQGLRVELARRLLASTELDLERVAEATGFGSSRQFRRVWRKFEGATPQRSRLRSLSARRSPLG
jgi:transcriptional regulator GlxA family with amidase domain